MKNLRSINLLNSAKEKCFDSLFTTEFNIEIWRFISLASICPQLSTQLLRKLMDKLMNKDECRMVRLILRNTSVNVLFDGSGEELMKKNVDPSKETQQVVSFLRYHLRKNLRTWPCIEAYNTWRSNRTIGLIYGDFSHFKTDGREEKEFLKSIAKETFAHQNL